MYRRGPKGWLKHLDFILLDLLSLQAAFGLAYIIRFVEKDPYADPRLYQAMAIVLLLADIVALFFFNTLKNVLKRGWLQEFLITVRQAILVELLATLYLFSVQRGYDFSRIVMFLTGFLYFIISYAIRLIWKVVLRKIHASLPGKAMLLVTTEAQAYEALANVQIRNYETYRIVGFAITDKDLVGASIGGIPVVATMDGVADYVCREWVDEIFLAPPQYAPYPADFVDRLILTGVTVHQNLVVGGSRRGRKQIIEKVGNYLVLTTSMNFSTTVQAFLKRSMDIVGGLVGCLLTGIIFVFVAPMIYHASPGPIFFVQERVGRNGKRFKMYKFRSMYLDAEERKKNLLDQNQVEDGMMFKMDFDPRVIGNEILPDGQKKTGIGDFIRRRSLDEFPQFFNVLKGDMSLVGTRPPTMDEWEKYEFHHRARLAIRPGITGMWQVSGRSDIVDFEEIVRLDTQYINDWSLGLDIKILLKTIVVVLKKDGSR